MRKLFVVIAALLISGCAEDINKKAAQTFVPIRQFCQAAATGPETTVLAGKTFLQAVTEINADMLSNPNVPTPEEATALSTLDARRAQCRQQVVAWEGKYMPGQVPIVQEQLFKETVAIGDLIQRATTYGEANHRIYQAYLDAVKAGLAERRVEIEDARAEQMRRLEITQAMMASIPKVQPPPPMPTLQMPRSTNCTSNAIGTTVYTNCQ